MNISIVKATMVGDVQKIDQSQSAILTLTLPLWSFDGVIDTNQILWYLRGRPSRGS